MASTAFINGTVITMDDSDTTAEAVLVEDGTITAVGSTVDIQSQAGGDAELIDLEGKTLLPGFVDPHSHFMNMVQFAVWANVSGEAAGGPVRSIPDIIDQLKAFQAEVKPAPGEWIVGIGYSDVDVEEGRNVTVDDLDPHFPDNPVLLFHRSNHGGVMNTLGLRQYDITADTPTPEAGVIARKEGSNEPAGFIFDTAWIPVAKSFPQPTEARLKEGIQKTLDLYASNGFTTAHEGATNIVDLGTLQKAAAHGDLFIDINALPLFFDAPEILKDDSVPWNTNKDGLRCAGIKILCDGSPQSLTGYFTKPYIVPGPDGEADWCGTAILPQEVFDQVTQLAYSKGLRMFTHANGDAAIDVAINTHKRADSSPEAKNRRSVIVHAQFARHDQLEQFAELGLLPTFFTNHAHFFSGKHRQNLGDARAEYLSPMRDAIDLGIKVTNHSDAGVTPLDPMLGVWTAVAREALDGRVCGEGQRVTPLEALKAITVWAAYEMGEEDTKGQIAPGMLADLVVLDANPLEAPTSELRNIKTMATYKAGKAVYNAA